MARYDFGGTLADFVVTSRHLGGLDVLGLSAATLTFWSAQSGGTQYTDLVLNGSAATSITVGTDGQVPKFQGPDGVTEMWADGGSPRVRVVTLQGAPGPAGKDGVNGLPGVNAVANDTATASYLTTAGSATQTAADARFSKKSTLPVNLKDFDAVGNGVADDSAALVRALATGRGVYIPAGSYLIQNVTYTGSARIYGDGEATILVSHGQPILKMDPGFVGGADHGSMSDLRLTCDADMAPGAALVTLARIRNFKIRNVNGAMVNDCQGMFWQFDTAYQIDVDTCMLRTNRYGVGFELNSFTRPAEQQDTISFKNVTCQGSSTAVIARSTNGNYHTLHFNGLKVVSLSPESGLGYDEGLLTAAAAAGDTVLTVGTQVSGSFAIGYTVALGVGGNFEVGKIAAVSGTSVTLSLPLRFAHPVGDPVIAHGVAVSLANNTYTVHFDQCHFERQSIGIMLGQTRAVSIDNSYNSCSELVRVAASGVRSLVIGPNTSEGKVGSNRNVICCLWAPIVASGLPPEVLLHGPFQTINAIPLLTTDAQGADLSNLTRVERVGDGGGSPSFMQANASSVGTAYANNYLQLLLGASPVYTLTKGGVVVAQGVGRYLLSVTGNVTLSDRSPEYIAVNTTAARTITLPTAASMTNRSFTVKDVTGSAGTNPITIQRASTNTIEGATSLTVNTNYGLVKLYSDGTTWLRDSAATTGSSSGVATPSSVGAARAGLVGHTRPSESAGNNSVALTTGTLYASRVVAEVDAVSGARSVRFGQAVAASGATLAKVAIYDAAGNLLGSSADISATINSGATTIRTISVGSFALTAGSEYWVAFITVGGTGPQLARGQANYMANAGLTGASVLWGTGATGLADLPATFTPGTLTASQIALWFGML